ncbi:GAF and ANTAR domain-containing protein [Williamsia herbipolensis]|uniref:GAF and ANTAR domain-containing protein n=1 Tax=Williamsia herbipolensis TaxID=1603258 RepID=UPI0023AA1B44|nr:GAF and ANTAR domain-containing protein [Williamsia herbipolensis]
MLTALTTGLVDAIETAQFATITLVENGEVVSIAVTDPIAARIDELQAKHDVGPCLMSAWEQQRVVIDDYSTETRWPLFTDDVIAQTPVRSSVSFQLYREESSMGALNIHADHPHAFDATAIALGSTFATQAASALHADARQTQFDQALASRDIIGQAKGMLMQEYNIDATAAFEMLRRISQDTNTKLAVLAHRVIASAQRPER